MLSAVRASRNGVFAVIALIKHQGQAIVDFGEIRLGFFGTAVFIERGVPVAFLLMDISESKMQRTVVRIIGEQIAEKLGRGVIPLFADQSSRLLPVMPGRRYPAPGLRRRKSSEQISSRSRRTQLGFEHSDRE